MLEKIIGNYQITSELARGGMGAVYRGRHQNLPREVVVKSILLSSFPPHAQDQLKARFVREAYIQSQLDHQNVVRVYEFFTTPENYYLVMEFVEGISLRDLIDRQGAIAPAHAVPLIKQALSALDYAHNFNYVDESGNRQRGVIHRDIKPANMLLDGMARLKITDFGIVKLAGESNLTQAGFNPGTVAYMSPEQIRGLEVDARSDLYSLGVAIYEALTGRLPFPPNTGSEYDVFRGHIELAPPPLATLKPDIPEALAALVRRSLEKDPGARFQSAAEFLSAILNYERSAPTTIEEFPRVTLKPPQDTHSMTERVSYDTRQAPVAEPLATPHPIQQPPIQQPPIQQSPIQQLINKQTIDPAPINYRAVAPSGQQPRRYWPLLAAALIVLLAAAGTAFVLLKPGSTPIPAAMQEDEQLKKARQAEQEDAQLKKARQAEAEERYYDAQILYGEYLAQHALDTDLGVKEIRDHSLKLGEFYSLFELGESARVNGNYAEAERNYAEALKLRPDSKIAQEALNKARSRQGRTY